LFYTDADMAFFSNAEEILEVMNGYSLLITPHENKIAEIAGIYNVGIVGYKNDQYCLEFLKWWEKKCIEWCEWRALSDGKCGDQGYLNIIKTDPQKFKNVLSCMHCGINLGPWNLALHKTKKENNNIILDDQYNLICYHFHHYKNNDGICFNDTGWFIDEWNMNNIYYPYHQMIIEEEKC
jgi:hypothetical protein